MRRVAHEGLNARTSVAYQQIQEQEASSLVSHIRQYPERWVEHFMRSASSSILEIVYGQLPPEYASDTVVERIKGVTHRLECAVIPGSYLVEVFPWLRYLPDRIAKWKREAREWFQKDTELFEGLLNTVAKKAVSHMHALWIWIPAYQGPHPLEGRRIGSLLCIRADRQEG